MKVLLCLTVSSPDNSFFKGSKLNIATKPEERGDMKKKGGNGLQDTLKGIVK